MTTALLMFLGFVAVTLVITYWAARSRAGRTDWPSRATT
jgi:Na+(H+)/acetate symporter ActP